jgi:catechol 2,3-dioxygenase
MMAIAAQQQAQNLTSMPSVKFSPRRLGHANLFVGELDRSVHFYEQIAGFEDAFRIDQVKAAFLTNGNTHHDLGVVECSNKPLLGRDGKPVPSSERAHTPGLNHMGWEMENEQQLVDAYHRAVEGDLPIYRLIDHQTAHSVYLFDPDGHENEIYADMIADWRGFFDAQEGRPVTGSWEPDAAPATDESRFELNPAWRRVEDAAVHSRRFTHITYLTANHGAMVDYYSDVMGLDQVFETETGDIVLFNGSGSNHAFTVGLVAQPAGAPATVHHYSYQAIDEPDLIAAEARIQSAGFAIERKVDNASKLALFVRDPDNMLCEFYVARDTDFACAMVEDTGERPYLL